MIHYLKRRSKHYYFANAQNKSFVFSKVFVQQLLFLIKISYFCRPNFGNYVCSC